MFRVVGKLVLGGTAVGATAVCAYGAYDDGVGRALKFLTKFSPAICEYSYCALATQGMPEEEVKAAFQALHKRYAPQVLQIHLDLGGYYIKMGQTLVGSGLVPEVSRDACPGADLRGLTGFTGFLVVFMKIAGV